MLIRRARYEDIAELVEMGARMHAEGAYAFLPFDREKVRRVMTGYIDSAETQCGLVAEKDGTIIGMLGGYLTDYFFCDERIACDAVLFIDQKYRGSTAARRLIRAFRSWANESGARELCLGISLNVDIERAGKFYERMGLERVGGVYKERLR
jgi:GNAT superfamily N-acetyltransferase